MYCCLVQANSFSADYPQHLLDSKIVITFDQPLLKYYNIRCINEFNVAFAHYVSRWKLWLKICMEGDLFMVPESFYYSFQSANYSPIDDGVHAFIAGHTQQIKQWMEISTQYSQLFQQLALLPTVSATAGQQSILVNQFQSVSYDSLPEQIYVCIIINTSVL